MRELTAKPERTFGLIVGIERYHQSTWNVKGGGLVSDALKFAEWLCDKQGVPQENIKLCLSPLEESQELVRQCQLSVAEATLYHLDDIINNFLLCKSGDLLFIFWAGHGLITSERARRLLCADANEQNWQNIDLNSLLLSLSSDLFKIRHQICIIDACANYYLDIPKIPTKLGSKIFNSGKPRQDSQQFVLLATRDGEKAKVSSQKTGHFSQGVRQALEQAPAESFPPNMIIVAEQVKQSLTELEKKQLPTYWYYRSWDGDKDEQYFNPSKIPHNISPSSAKAFVGREKQLEQLHELLRENDIVAITDVTGEGGVGKTELAIRYSFENLENSEGGCCWLNVNGTDIGTQLTEFGIIHFPNFNPSGLSLNGQIHERIRELLRLKLEDIAEVETHHDASLFKRGFCQAMTVVAQDIPLTPTQIEIAEASLAIPHLAEAATIYQDWLGDEDLICVFVGLCRFYRGQGAYEQALPWYTQSLSVTRKRFGEEHPDVATSLNNLALLYDSLGRYSEAEPLYIQALEMTKRLLGEQHPDVAKSLNNAIYSVVINLGYGNLYKGFPVVSAKLWELNNPRPQQFVGSLPPASNLVDLYRNWLLMYQCLHNCLTSSSMQDKTRNTPHLQASQENDDDELEINESEITNVSVLDFKNVCQKLQLSINIWLESPGIVSISRQLRATLNPADEIRIIIETQDITIQKLPWHLCSFFEDYPRSEISFSRTEYKRNPKLPLSEVSRNQVR
ncbi:MAG: tetratricopeptide repeat protein, partial [Rhizonema sp. PD38]|nr:tetratricopeptide repeat protein [Rhizonema sp. PD38]